MAFGSWFDPLVEPMADVKAAVAEMAVRASAHRSRGSQRPPCIGHRGLSPRRMTTDRGAASGPAPRGRAVHCSTRPAPATAFGSPTSVAPRHECAQPDHIDASHAPWPALQRLLQRSPHSYRGFSHAFGMKQRISYNNKPLVGHHTHTLTDLTLPPHPSLQRPLVVPLS